MKTHNKQFLGMDPEFHDYSTAAIAIMPIPFEGGISYGSGTLEAPNAIITASPYLEMFDEVYHIEPYRTGVTTISPLPVSRMSSQEMVSEVYSTTKQLLYDKKFIISLGGDHSVSLGFCKALIEQYGTVSIIQLDAHADLRDSYEGSIYSHASIMARLREITTSTLQLGIRSMSLEESQHIEKQHIRLYTMHQFRKKSLNLIEELNRLHDTVIITLDVDVFDWSVISSTGTPEPGGILWDEMVDLLETIFLHKNVIGFDVVELAARNNDTNSAFATAKIIYKMIGLKLISEIRFQNLTHPSCPRGPFFRQFLDTNSSI